MFPSMTVVIPVLLIVFLLGFAFPAYATVTAFPVPVVKDPKHFPSHRSIQILEGYLFDEEAHVFINWIWPLWDELPHTIFVQVCRPKPDHWMKKPSIHIFLLNSMHGVLGTGTGVTFEKATQSLVRNLINQGYLISPEKKEPQLINLPLCKDDDKKQTESH